MTIFTNSRIYSKVLPLLQKQENNVTDKKKVSSFHLDEAMTDYQLNYFIEMRNSLLYMGVSYTYRYMDIILPGGYRS